MPRLDNYPDDIRQYDDDPRSPFYVDPMEAIYDARDALVDEWQKEYARTGKVEWFGGDPREELAEGETLGALFDRNALAEVSTHPDTYITSNNWE